MPSIQNFISDVELGQFEHLLGLLLEGATVCEQENIAQVLFLRQLISYLPKIIWLESYGVSATISINSQS